MARYWRKYVPVASRRARAVRQLSVMRGRSEDAQPVVIEGRQIAHTFWGEAWCEHLEQFSDFENRLPRGRTYVRNGSVCHLEIATGQVRAVVIGRDLYDVTIEIDELPARQWRDLKGKCAGQIGSLLELLEGRLSDRVMAEVCDVDRGLFPKPAQIHLACSCPDWAVMCKHVAAVLYGVGSRLDSRPELLFLLRDVDAQELISTEMAVPSAVASGGALDDDQLGDIFDIELDVASATQPAPKTRQKRQLRSGRRAGLTTTKKEPRSALRRKPPPIAIQTMLSGKAKLTNAVRKKPARATTNNRTQAKDAATRKIRPTGKSVAGLRRQLKLSAGEFAKRLDVTAASVYRWEATIGRLKLRAGPLAALAKLKQQAQRK